MTRKSDNKWKNHRRGKGPTRAPEGPAVAETSQLSSGDQDLAEMSRRLEAALRRTPEDSPTLEPKTNGFESLEREMEALLGKPRRGTDAQAATAQSADLPAQTSSQLKPTRAPTDGFVIDLLVPAERAEDMLLMLQRAFEERWLPKYGFRRARYIFAVQSIGAVIGYWISWAKQYLSVLKFLGS